MQSPKFPSKRADIEGVINASALRSRWRDKVRDAMRKQPIPDPVEHLDFHTSLDALCKGIAAEISSGQYTPRPPIRYLSEKSKGLCRQLVIPSVKDALVLQTLSDALWVELRTKAPSKNAFYAPNDQRFSQAIRGYTDEYGPINLWLSFQTAILGFATTKKYVVVTDIANYYDFISYDHLRNILSDLAIVREHSLDLLLYTLSHMLWQPDYMPRVQIGLPQIPFLDAPRLLAHCFLFEIDRLLSDRPHTDFARYMDDIDVGVDTIPDAKVVLRDLDLSLQTRQIRLNSGKTLILSDTEARRHFRIRDNALLDRLEDQIISKIGRGADISRERRFIERFISVGLTSHRFEGGNGDKILRRCINYARRYGAVLGDTDLLRLLLKWPTARSPALQWWQHSASPGTQLELIRDFVRSNEIIDDASFIDVSIALVSAKLPRSVKTWRLIEDICKHLDDENVWVLYSKLWILSKYGTEDEVMQLIETRLPVWITEEQASRLVGGMYSRFVGSLQFPKFRAIIQRSGNQGSRDVFDFYDALVTTSSGFRAVLKFMRTPNPSFPNRISHAKFLMVRAGAHNTAVPAAIPSLIRTHSRALQDEYYRALTP